MTRRVARAALACAAVGARAQFCEVTIQVDGAGVGLAFADDAELDAAVRGFVARFALPLDQMGCADDGCAVEYIKAHARLNAACDADRGGGERAEGASDFLPAGQGSAQHCQASTAVTSVGRERDASKSRSRGALSADLIRV